MSMTSLCLELLTSGVVAINGAAPDVSTDNLVVNAYPNIIYALPTRENIELYGMCKNSKVVLTKKPNIRQFYKKLD